MSITVRTSEGDDHTFANADDFRVDFDSGTLTVATSDERGEPLTLHAVFASGRWAAVFNDDAAKVTA